MDISKLPEEVRALASGLFQQVSWLRARWKIFMQLYGTSPERVELLNRSARLYFYVSEQALMHDVILGICRLTDPAYAPMRSRRENESLNALVERLDTETHGELRSHLAEKMGDLVAHVDPMRQLRNRAIAHADLATAQAIEPAPDVPMQSIQHCIDEIEDVYYTLLGAFSPGVDFDRNVVLDSDGETLIAVLRDAETYRQEQRDRRTGTRAGIRS